MDRLAKTSHEDGWIIPPRKGKRLDSRGQQRAPLAPGSRIFWVCKPFKRGTPLPPRLVHSGAPLDVRRSEWMLS